VENDKMPPTYPGEVLLEEFIVPLGMTQHRVAVDIGVPPRRINEIVHGKGRITAITALRLGRYLGTTAQFWVNLQTRGDLDVERDNLGVELDLTSPLPSACLVGRVRVPVP
jgi:addiction module HigA family antidote